MEQEAPKAYRARLKAAVGYYHYVDYYYDDDTTKLDVLVTPMKDYGSAKPAAT
jgi:hypothetical protein